jgi:hypothetical protein
MTEYKGMSKAILTFRLIEMRRMVNLVSYQIRHEVKVRLRVGVTPE